MDAVGTMRLSRVCAPTSASDMPMPQATMKAIAGIGPPIEPIAATGRPHNSRPPANHRESRALPTSSAVATIAPIPAPASSTPSPERPSESRRTEATTASAIHRPRTSERRHEGRTTSRTSGSRRSSAKPGRGPDAPPPAGLAPERPRRHDPAASSPAEQSCRAAATPTAAAIGSVATSRLPRSAPAIWADVLTFEASAVAADSSVRVRARLGRSAAWPGRDGNPTRSRRRAPRAR